MTVDSSLFVNLFLKHEGGLLLGVTQERGPSGYREHGPNLIWLSSLHLRHRYKGKGCHQNRGYQINRTLANCLFPSHRSLPPL